MNTSAFELVKSVVESMGVELGYSGLRSVTPETSLFGGEDGIDSLSLVHIVAETERVTEEKIGKCVVLADESAMSRRNSPYRTVGTLADFLQEKLAE